MRGKEFDDGFEYGFVTAISRALKALDNIDISDGKLNALGIKILITKALEELKDNGYVS